MDARPTSRPDTRWSQTDESSCERLGDLAASAFAKEGPVPDAREWAEIEAKLGRRLGRPPMRRLWPLLGVATLLLACAGVWLASAWTLGYRAQGCISAPDGSLQAPGGGAITFSDGSRVELVAGARVRVRPVSFARGADLSLKGGGARLDIVHRTGARWAVLAGPFHIAVTGTRFDVHWSPQQGRMRISMLAGEVRVSGGPLAHALALRAGQTMLADRNQPTVRISNDFPNERPADGASEQPPSHNEKIPAPAPAPALAPSPHAPASLARTRAARPRSTEPKTQASIRRQRIAPPTLATEEPATNSATPAPIQETNPLRRPGSTVPTPLPPRSVASSQPAPSPSPAASPRSHAEMSEQGRPGPRPVAIANDGQLSGGMTGFAWLARGSATTLSLPATHAEHLPLRPTDGQLCTSGTIAGLACVNEGTPQIRCNWDRNWGVAIGFDVRADHGAWGDASPGSLAVEFHGWSGNYRLLAHRKGDPMNKIYCIDNYHSGQTVQASMFKSQCWAGTGASLPSFAEVDSFNLMFPSRMDYVAFHYCVSAVKLYP